jgi:hypothetical protein
MVELISFYMTDLFSTGIVCGEGIFSLAGWVIGKLAGALGSKSSVQA